MALRGDRATLRPLEWEDLPSVVRWLNDPEVMEHMLSSPLTTLEEQEEWFRAHVGSDDRAMAIEDGEGRLLGYCGITRVDWVDRSCSIWVIIGEKDSWGRGYGTDAVRTMARYLFDELGLVRIVLRVDPGNERAIRAYRRCGFQEEGIQRKARFKDGAYRDDLIMSLTRDQRTDS